MITVRDLLDLFVDVFGMVEIYDVNSGEVVFYGDEYDIPERYEWLNVESIDYPDGKKLTFNVEVED